MFQKLFLSALAIASIANAATNVCNETSITANVQSDLDNLSGCTTFGGDIILSPTLSTATINGIQNISGSLICNNNTQITSISAPLLRSIGGTFQLSQLTILNTLSFPRLSSVGTIDWVTLPAVSGLSFTTGVTSCQDITISDTDLTSLTGINLTTVSKLDINNNLNLNDIEMGLTEATYQVDISFNGQTAVSFPYLQWAYNLTFQNVHSVDTPVLSVVNASYLLIKNVFSSISAPNLTTVGGLSIDENLSLTNMSFPKLTTIGGSGLQISNNTRLSSIGGFPNLSTVNGAIVLDGDFTNATFPSLTLVRGAVNIDSDDDFDCSSFNSLNSNGGIRGNDYKCAAASTTTSVALSATAAASSGATGGSVTSGSGTSSASSAATVKSAASPNLVATSTGFTLSALLTAVFFGIF
ncbi:uncharacterized protein V1513DRAFT_441340 [Lipomyces chichibuensis]|uniref:uncharacterized protein n=1 Tax=Lipomyces chichibuensis TaxID=1546026 RepID=UPI003342FCF6